MNIELTSFLDAKQNIWFLGKEIATILGYCNISKCIWDHVPCEDKCIISLSSKTEPQVQARNYTIINKSGLYSLILSSKLASAKRFKHRVTSKVLPSIRKHGYYMSFNKPWNKMIMIGNETDLHYKVVDLIRRYYRFKFILSNDYDEVCIEVHDYMKGVRVPCKYCIKHFYNNDTLETHYRVIHRLSN